MDAVCRGRASCVVNLLCAPIVLPYRSFGIYVVPCLALYAHRAFELLLACCLDRGCCLHSDHEFEGDAALGRISKAPEKGVVWRRITDLDAEREELAEAMSTDLILSVRPPAGVEAGGAFEYFVEARRQTIKVAVPKGWSGGELTLTLRAKPPLKKAALIRDGIQPSDVGQGALGDCWLLSAFACLAEYPGALENLLVTKEVNRRGCYTVRLYDDKLGAWRDLVIDDRIPCDGGTGKPLFAQPHDGELWVLVLEKAFAKLCGSYGNLEGGITLWALHAMTGDHVFGLRRVDGDGGGGRWKRLDMTRLAEPSLQHVPRLRRRAVSEVGLYSGSEMHDVESLWRLLQGYRDHEALLAASLSEGEEREARRSDGLITHHSYSLIRVVDTAAGTRMVQLRNPWGHSEWSGAWSDRSTMWDDNPAVAAELWPERQSDGAAEANSEGGGKGGGGADDDGVFWMSFDDFCTIFTEIEVCDRSTGMHDLSLSVDGDAGALAPCLACCSGCASFWCLCRGCRALYFFKESNKATRILDHGPLHACCCGCLTCFRRLWAACVNTRACLARCCPSSAEEQPGRKHGQEMV
jgi:hypothetical protein